MKYYCATCEKDISGGDAGDDKDDRIGAQNAKIDNLTEILKTISTKTI